MARCLTKPRQVFEIALRNEHRAKRFYDRMATAASDSNIRRLAAERANEEAQHIAYIERALQGEGGAATALQDPSDATAPPARAPIRGKGSSR